MTTINNIICLLFGCVCVSINKSPVAFAFLPTNSAMGSHFIPLRLTMQNKNYDNDYSHLDAENIKKLEKLFYLKNYKYSPFKTNKYFIKYINPNPYNNSAELNNFSGGNGIQRVNVTKLILEIQEELENNIREQMELERLDMETLQKFINDDDDEDEDDGDDDDDEDDGDDDDDEDDGDDDDNDLFGSGSHLIKKHHKNGYFDPLGIFRYNANNANRNNINSAESNGRKTNGGGGSGGDEFTNDNNFQIIKNVEEGFSDVGGYDNIKSELMQTSDILINFDKYAKFNVRTPKGLILEGPPGNGKTLIAKAFAGELNISFIPVSGSEFSEKYVGVGASRIRDLFKLAENHKPCIIFIDEIDAVARKRGNDEVSSNSEKDQTLNQLLIALDGFKKSNGVFLIGATNRVDLLDAALIRPGRMDKNIYIGNPDAATRREILQIHIVGKPLVSGIDIEQLVEMTAGFSGAQIENLLNESMLRALRDNREIIGGDDLEHIMNRIIAGWQSTESTYTENMIQRIVIHEMGHAIVGFFAKDHPKLTKVSINLWSPKTPGYTLFDTSDENVNIYTKNGLFSHLMVLLGGRIAEELFFGFADVTTGARKDLEEAYKLAQDMVLHYGMGDKNIYPTLSDHSKYMIDQEVNKLLMKANDAAVEIVRNNKQLIADAGVILRRDKVLKPEQIVGLIEAAI